MRGFHSVRLSLRHLLLVGVSTAASCAAAAAWAADGNSQAAPDASTPAAAQPAPAEVREVVVTGSYLRNIRQEDRASPVETVNQRQLQETGVLSLGDLTKFIPQDVGSTGGVQDLAKGGYDTHDTRSANLRGLGAGATLVLLNGRRVVPLDGYVNLNSLTPDIAIERVETVLDGASATYGADAVAGVVNVITNTHFTGFEISGQYTDISKSPDSQVQAMFGGGTDRFHIVTAVSYTRQEKLQNADRSITNFWNPSTGAGANPGSYTMTSRPVAPGGGDVVINGHDYSTLYDRYNVGGKLTVADPDCGSAATKSVFTPSASGPGWGVGSCSFSYQAQNPLRPESASFLEHTDARYEIDPALNLFFESAYYHQDAKRYGVPSYAQNHNGATGPIVPASNPGNPFGVPVAFSGRAVGSEEDAGLTTNLQRDQINQFQNVIGAEGDFWKSFHYTADASWSRGVFFHEDHDTDMYLFQAALNGYGGQNCNYRFNGPGVGAVAGAGNCYYFSPFAKNNATNNPATAFNIQTPEYLNFTLDYLIGEGVVNGTLAHIFGRPLDVAFGAQIRHESQSRTYSDLYQCGCGGFNGPSHNTSGARDVKSVFGEANYPILPTMNVDVAVRHEDYGGFQTTNPKVAINWRVVPQLALRASWSTAFQAPSLDNSSAAQIGSGVTNITDPNDHTTLFRTVVTLGNPALQPQTSTVYNFGFTVLPVKRASFSIDYWRYAYDNQIETQNPQAVINATPNGSQVIRDQNGVAQTIYVKTFNAPSGTQTSGIDGALLYGFDLGPVRVDLHDNASFLISYDIDTGALVYDGVGRRNNTTTSPGSAAAAPRWRNIAGVSGVWGPQALDVDVRYISSVMDDYFLPVQVDTTRRVAGFTAWDWQYSYRFGPSDRFKIATGMINALDKNPSHATYTGYLSSLEDALGRQFYLRLDARF